jgi:O-succinylbenzoic acid--CoA ligase
LDNPYAFFISDKNIKISLITTTFIPIKKIYNELNDVEKFTPFEIDAEASATMIFSSGSSSSPKAVLHCFNNHHFSASGSNENIYFWKGDVWLLSLPLYHVAGLSVIFRALISGAAIRILHNSELVRDVLWEESVSHLSLVETQLSDLLADESLNEKLLRLKAILIGGSAISSRLVENSYRKGWNIYSTYGSTEMTSQVSTTSAQASLRELITNGKLLKYRNLMISRENEVLVKGKTLCLGYLKNGKLINIRDENGWFSSGDLGMIDENGFLHIQGRKDNMFISGGENIYPEFIERKIKELPNVLKALIVPVKNEKFGFRPSLFLQMKRGEIPDVEKLKELLQDKLVKYMIPDYIFPWPEKIEKKEIKISRKYFETLAKEMI